jgi:uncharacterized protein
MQDKSKTAGSVGATAAPWWKFPYVWLVIAGPAAVVVASAVTVWLTLAYPETVVAQDYYRRGLQINRELAARTQRAMTPALEGRNHAAAPLQREAGAQVR